MNLNKIIRQGILKCQAQKFSKLATTYVGLQKLCNCRTLSTTTINCDKKNFAKSVKKDQEHQEKISRYPVNNIKDLPLHVQERMYGLYDKAGFVPNLFHALAHRPEEFKCFLDYYDALTNREKSNLTRADKEMIGIVASSYNGCVYCVMAHSALHRITSKDPYLADQLATNYQTAKLDARQRAILALSNAVTKNQPITDEHFQDLEKVGLNREDAWDVAAFASLTSLINRMSVFLDIKPNPEFYTMGRRMKDCE